MSATAAIIDFASANHVLSAETKATTIRLLGDTLVGAAAGGNGGEAAHLEAVLRVIGDGKSRVFCDDSMRCSAERAAFHNGFAIHCLEWDAVHEPAVVHAMSVVTAALLAISDRQGGYDPDHFLTCLAVGVDIASGIGVARPISRGRRVCGALYKYVARRALRFAGQKVSELDEACMRDRYRGRDGGNIDRVYSYRRPVPASANGFDQKARLYNLFELQRSFAGGSQFHHLLTI